jgi:predicted Zn-dependent protease
VDGNVFYHPELKFQFPVPPGWELENSPIQVKMNPSDGKALMIFTMAQEKTLDDAAKNTLQRLQLNLLESNKTTVKGMPAVSTLSNQTSQDPSTGQQLTIKVLSYFIDYSGTCYVFHGLSTEADFADYTVTFESTMANFNRLTDPSKLNVQPRRIRTKKVPSSVTLANAFQSFGIAQEQMKELAFLNNMDLTDQVPAGTFIKIVGE